ncbi:hypothetical protein N7520_003676 [Penicillium odoratum]|uniref:uncharacterized protein n=1 Tax=Penicillium odoratum TaxID=1167516 RepID=UPI0025477539|nr:uncharacterized protein N7520_003676 [Penicillium odoratum]KAJ5769117.1 hypothetical protein N7520_003676 [Penicillium odoratum]
MDSSGALRPLDEALLRELPQLSLRIAPLREPVASRTLSIPSPLEPNASRSRESNIIPKSTSTGGNAPTNSKASLPTVTEFLNAARTEKAEPVTDSSNVEPLPKPILPAFVNLRALERFPFSSSFDDDALHGTRKRRRLDLTESFSEHLQLPIPQAQKEQRPPPFGPFAILNGLNEPPPNAALLPPIEAGSIPQLLTKPSREDTTVDPAIVSTGALSEGHPVERREARIEELLDATLDDHNDDVHDPEDEKITQTENRIKSVIPDEKACTSNDITSTPPAPGGPLSKTQGRPRKNLRKWTEEETNDLYRGVVKCGIGNWTAILAQPELKFKNRTASNLKDRFRVCCPWAYRASDPNEATKKLRDNLANALLKSQADASDGTSSKVRPPLQSPTNVGSELSSTSGSPVMSSQNPPKSVPPVNSEKDLRSGSPILRQSPPAKDAKSSSEYPTNLESLGIPEPYVSVKSKRRSRRPFTTAEDEALLKGYAVHGFQWTLIQQDKRLNLGHRKATDLRDRFRTKFPHVYRDGGSVNGKASKPPKLETAKSDPGPVSRDRQPSESTPTKAPVAHRRSDSHVHTRQLSNASHSNTGAGPFDPSFLPPPQGFLEPSANALSFSLDENPAAASSPWEDNTLAPMIWDDLS